jgi:hypothetical protein
MAEPRPGGQPELNAVDGGPITSPLPTSASRLCDLAMRESADAAPAAHMPDRSRTDVNMCLALDRWQDDGGRE